jgi:hypothetical protein
MGTETGFLAAFGMAGWLLTQPPASDPPRLLPASITGSAPAAVVPVASTNVAVPNERFKSLGNFPPETIQCVVGLRAGGDWLGKIHQANGRVLAGVNPALAAVWGGDSDARQAVALWGLAKAAKFTGDGTLTAKSQQSLLAVLSTIRPEADGKTYRPGGPDDEKPVVAAGLILAASELPTVDDRTAGIAEHMAALLANAADGDAATQALVLRALAVSHRGKPAEWKGAAIAKRIERMAAQCRSKCDPVLAGGLLVTLAESADPNHQSQIAGLAESLMALQYDRTTVRGGFVWAGAFKCDDREPGYETAWAAWGLVAATAHARKSGDIARYQRTRHAMTQAILFVRGLQATPENSSHFESGFRMRSIVGGVRAGVTDGVLRADATALAIVTFANFAESGLEGRD